MLEHLGKSSVSIPRICFVYSSTVEGINKFMLVSTYANLHVCNHMRARFVAFSKHEFSINVASWICKEL